MFGSLGDLMGLLGNLGKIGKDFENVNGELKQQRLEASAGGEQVKVVLNGLGDLVDINISPALAGSGDVEMLEDLIKSAFASAQEQSRQLGREQMSKVLEGLPLGPLKALLGQ